MSSELDEHPLAEDPNYQAFQKDVQSGMFQGVLPGLFVAYAGNELVSAKVSEDTLMRDLDQKGVGPAYIAQVNTPLRVVDLEIPRSVDTRK